MTKTTELDPTERERLRAKYETPAPPDQIYVCGACGRTAITRGGLRDASCVTWAVLCYATRAANGDWIAVPEGT